MFGFAAEVDGVAQFVVVVVVGAPKNGLIAFLQRALGRQFESSGRAALRDGDAGGVRRWRLFQGYHSGLARADGRLRLRSNTRFLKGDAVNDRGDVAREIGEAHPFNAVARAAIVNDGFPLDESRGRGFDGGAGFGVGTEPARPLLAGVLGVAGADKKLEPRVICMHCCMRCIRTRGVRMGGGFGRGRRRRAPPFEATPLRKKLRIKRAGFVGTFCLVFGTERKNFSGIGGAQENLAGRIAGDAGDLRGACLGKLCENTAAVNGKKRAVVAGTGEEAAVGGETESVDDVFAGRPEFFRGAVRAEAIDAAGEKWREGNELLLQLRLAGTYLASRCEGGCALRSSNHDVGRGAAGARLFTNGGGIESAVGCDGKRGDFALGSFVENETFSCGFPRIARYAEDAAAGFRAGNQIAAAVEGEDADVSFVAGVEELAFAVGRNGEDLAFVAGGDEERAVGSKGEIPDIFCFGVKEYGFFASRGNLVDLAVGGGADIERALGVEGDGLSGKVRGVEHDGWFAVRIKAKYFCGRAAGGEECAFRIESDGPEIGGIGVGEKRELGSELEAAVASNSDTVGGAFQEFFIGGLAPATGVLRMEGDGNEVKDAKEVEDSEIPCST